MLQEWSGDRLQVEPSAVGSVAHGEHEHEDHKFTLLVKYIIRPSIQKEFIGAWLKVSIQMAEHRQNMCKTLEIHM